MIQDDIKDCITNGKLYIVADVINQALEHGISPDDILSLMMAAMDEVGDMFQNNDIYVPDMLISAKTMQRGVSILESKFQSQTSTKIGKVILGTVSGDLHDIGKNLVKIMLQANRFEVIDLGIDVPPEDFVSALKDNKDCKIVALSCLLTFTMPAVTETIDAIRNSKYGKNIKIMIGGAVIDQKFADQVGADCYTDNAVSAAKKAIELING